MRGIIISIKNIKKTKGAGRGKAFPVPYPFGTSRSNVGGPPVRWRVKKATAFFRLRYLLLLARFLCLLLSKKHQYRQYISACRVLEKKNRRLIGLGIMSTPVVIKLSYIFLDSILSK